MNEKRKDFLPISLLLFAAILSVWLGVAGPLFDNRHWMHVWHLMERWQTFIAALLALSAAWWAARPVQKQLAEQRRQSAAAAATMIAKSAIELEDERARLMRGRDGDLEGLGTVLSGYDEQSWHDIYHSWPNLAYRVSDACSALVAILHRTNERNPEITSLQKSRAATISALDDLRNAILGLAEHFHHETSGGPAYELGEQDIPEDEGAARRPRVDAKRAIWKAAADDLESELNAEISRVWRRVRQLERIAIGRD
jgi:hypothetical protein